jgi:SAM-dependent methyltransferase
MRVQLLGGFLGAGKTSLARGLAARLQARGESVAIITNDQGRSLVDTRLCQRDGRAAVSEITGGCFCCRYDALEAALEAARAAGATVTIAEAVGSCTDLVATVIAPLAERRASQLRLAPLTVVVDPWRARESERGALHPDVDYLFRKQLEEADVIVTSRADLDPPDVRAFLRSINASALIVALSSFASGAALDEWYAAAPSTLSPPLHIDYDRYAAAEAMLGWFNATVTLRSARAFDANLVLERFAQAMSAQPIAHLKVTGGSALRAAIVRAGDAPTVERSADASAVTECEWLVNARAALGPDALSSAINAAMARAAEGLVVAWSDREAFSPSRPTPTHRYASRCGADDEASCCAAFYERDDVRVLLGDSWHPGGVELTLAMADKLGLRAGQRILDVACGKGTSLQAIVDRHDVRAVGMDAQRHGEPSERVAFVKADAHEIPFEERSFDAVLCECALSTFFDQPGALREVLRVLAPGGRLAISDMVVEGVIPKSLEEWVHTGTCLSRAMTVAGYAQALTDAGFIVRERSDASVALLEMLQTIKRNLVGIALAQAAGQLVTNTQIDMKYARATLKEAEKAVREGRVGYAVLIAEKPAASELAS